MVNSTSSPAVASSQFAAASAVPAVSPARMSLSRCLSSDGTINIEKYRLYRQSTAAAFLRRLLVAMDSLLDGELNTHRVDRMVAAPPPTVKKKRAPRGVLARKDTEDGPLEIILPEDSLVQSVCQQFCDAGTGIVHGEEIPAIGSVCLRKRIV
jgi:hypothetical protein